MADEPFNLGFEEAAVAFASASQNARVWTEQWAGAHLFCPNCGAARITQYTANRPLADFFCDACGEQFELKSKKGRFGPKVADGAYGAKLARLGSSAQGVLLAEPRGPTAGGRFGTPARLLPRLRRST